MTSLCVTDLLNILLVDGVPLPQEDDAVAEAEEAAPRKGAAIVLPTAGEFCLCLPRRVPDFACLLFMRR